MSAAPALVPCVQCRSLYCGTLRCRFTGLDHPKAEPVVEPVEQCLYYRMACTCGLAGCCLEVA